MQIGTHPASFVSCFSFGTACSAVALLQMSWALIVLRPLALLRATASSSTE